MRVAIVIQHLWPDPGGAEIQAWMLARALAARLGACDAVTSRHDPARSREERVDGVRIVRLESTRSAFARRLVNGASSFAYFLRHARDYDVVYGHCLSLFVLGALAAARLRGRPVVLKPCTVGACGDVAKVCGRAGGSVLWRLFARADAFFVESSGAALDLTRAGIDERRILVVPNLPSRPGLASGRIAADPAVRAARRVEMRRALGLPERLTILFAGRLVPGKGLDVLMPAFEALARDVDASLVVVGDGPERATLGAWIERAGLGERVRLVGWQADPDRYFEASEVLAHASRSEAFANVLLEAMTAGLAIVTPPVGLAPDHLADGESALFVPIGDASALHHALARLAVDEELRVRLGSAAKRVADERFDAGRSLDRCIAELERVAAQGTSGSASTGHSASRLSS